MKKIAKYTAIAALAIGFAGCNDSFLDKLQLPPSVK